MFLVEPNMRDEVTEWWEVSFATVNKAEAISEADCLFAKSFFFITQFVSIIYDRLRLQVGWQLKTLVEWWSLRLRSMVGPHICSTTAVAVLGGDCVQSWIAAKSAGLWANASYVFPIRIFFSRCIAVLTIKRRQLINLSSFPLLLSQCF